MPSREQATTGGDPLVFFGKWCGPGWSAGHKSTEPLSAKDYSVPEAPLMGSNGRNRASPVDQACKVHDTRYDAADRTEDTLKRAQIILAADLELLAKVSQLHKLSQSGKLDLNAGEILFADNMQIAFNAKLIHDDRQVAILRLERAIGPIAMNALRSVSGPASIMVLGFPTLPKGAATSPKSKPAHAPKRAIVRFDSDATLASALASNHRGSSIEDVTMPRSDN